ncbi:stage II sporulation protein M [Acetivibrio ethanolgignens]|uniref:Stage II sporulation protein M n=1 Tax=Acetivibrio ethanolgignens TaxID=290052 RepID=A0A0V8QFD5_9FIRM|nr:stage II sporulation protein M [Acetivibrio ethanolgignens]KSV59180.1 hypothetical protein ASU35_10075 [Acetivibrio ethanolgignens]
MRKRAGLLKIKKPQFYQIAAVLFGIGIIAGILFSQGVYKSHPVETGEFFQQIGNNISQEEIDYMPLLKKILGRQLKGLGLLMVFSISVLGLPYIGGFLLYKGCISGFLIGSVFFQFGIKGSLLAVSLFFPQCFFYVPAYFSILSKGYRLGMEGHERASGLYKELPAVFAVLAILITGCILEAYANTWILRQIFALFLDTSF